jgi:hypothetical protein
MPSLTDHQSGKFTKLLIIGDSGTGKTGGLASLVPDFKLRILDFDNGLDPLKQQIKRVNPANLASVEFRTLRDKVKASAAGPIIDGQPKAFVEALKMLDNWKYGDTDLTWQARRMGRELHTRPRLLHLLLQRCVRLGRLHEPFE